MTAVLLVLALAASRSGDSTGAILDSLAKAGRALKTMAADFVQTKVTVLLDEKEEASGRILLKI
ncbi:MAG TPA: hypothetical protein VN083_05985, partial [Vicinamibacteria bacterium]|nr:hypothetical protein [Vicinamibacteria bacterium]